MTKKQSISIVIPVFNDWDCLKLLLKRINDELEKETILSIFVVNDCSTIDFSPKVFSTFYNLRVINLVKNIGHQKAISIGLSYVAEHDQCDAVIVMDADGEDQPKDLKLLLAALVSHEKIIFAKRKKRQETLSFKIFYLFYKLSFLLLVGKDFSFGNYCIIPFQSLKKLVHVSEIWNHFSGGILRSKLPYTYVELDRGKRLTGESKMNFVSLIIHGISSYTVFLEIVVVRLLILFGLLASFSLLGTIVVISLKFFTDLAIPGWTTYSVIGFGMIVLQAFFIIMNLSVTVLYYRTQKLFIPAIHYNDYISNG